MAARHPAAGTGARRPPERGHPDRGLGGRRCRRICAGSAPTNLGLVTWPRGPGHGSCAEEFAALHEQGLIRHLGRSAATLAHVEDAFAIARSSVCRLVGEVGDGVGDVELALQALA
jgi:hypothetical protein